MAAILAAQNGNWSDSATWVGGVKPGVGDTAYTNGKTVTIDEDIEVSCLSSRDTDGASLGGSFFVASTRMITADVEAGSSHGLRVQVAAADTVTLIGDVAGSTAAYGASGVHMVGSMAGHVLIIGSVMGGVAALGGQGCLGIRQDSDGVMTVVGDAIGAVTGSLTNTAAVVYGLGTIEIIGQVVGMVAHAVEVFSNGAVTVTGNVFGSSVAGIGGLRFAFGSVVINGSVFGGAYNSDSSGAKNYGSGMLDVYGDAVAGSMATGVIHSGTGLTRVHGAAVGNAYGNGSVGMSPTTGVIVSVVTGTLAVSSIEYGSRGMSPTSGPVFFAPAADSIARFRLTTHTDGVYDQWTLTDPLNEQDWPAESDVRLGRSFKEGDLAGTLAVPPPASVAAGVPTDDTLGTAALTSADILAALLASPLGQRLQQCATVEAVGQMLAAFEAP